MRGREGGREGGRERYYMLPLIPTHAHTRTHTYMHMHLYVCIFLHARTHTRVRRRWMSRRCWARCSHSSRALTKCSWKCTTPRRESERGREGETGRESVERQHAHGSHQVQVVSTLDRLVCGGKRGLRGGREGEKKEIDPSFRSPSAWAGSLQIAFACAGTR